MNYLKQSNSGFTKKRRIQRGAAGISLVLAMGGMVSELAVAQGDSDSASGAAFYTGPAAPGSGQRPEYVFRDQPHPDIGSQPLPERQVQPIGEG